LLRSLDEVCCGDPGFVYCELFGDSGEGAPSSVTTVLMCDPCLGQQ
jgi:hypothetical protein